MDLIDRDALLQDMTKRSDGISDWHVFDVINEQPTIEPEVRHGRWIALEGWFNKGNVKCSACRNTLDMHGVNAGRGDANFCPNCGAKMDGGDPDARL